MFLLFCWFLASMYWAWLWYTQRRDARRDFDEQYDFPFDGMQLRDSQETRYEGEVGFSLWLNDISRSEFAGEFFLPAW